MLKIKKKSIYPDKCNRLKCAIFDELKFNRHCRYYRVGKNVFYNDRAEDSGFCVKNRDSGMISFCFVDCVNKWAELNQIVIPDIKHVHDKTSRIENYKGAMNDFFGMMPKNAWKDTYKNYIEDKILFFDGSKWIYVSKEKKVNEKFIVDIP